MGKLEKGSRRKGQSSIVFRGAIGRIQDGCIIKMFQNGMFVIIFVIICHFEIIANIQ